MFAITFYSFKGGVGRTTALVHTAWLLQESGKKVLVCDMDLDAPGFIHQPFMAGVSAEKGFVDFVVDYLATAEVPPIGDYIASSQAGFDVLPAGGLGDTEYTEKLGGIDWNKLNEQYYGPVVVERLHGQLTEAGYDYVLVDSKTGFSDVGGFCTLQLPHAVALVFGLNDQNLAGIRGVYGLIRERNDADPVHRIDVVPVVCPYWPLSSDVLADRMGQAKAIFGRDELATVAFDTALAFRETVIFEHEFARDSQAANDYRRLCERLRTLNPDDEPRVKKELDAVVRKLVTGQWMLEPALADAGPGARKNPRERLADRAFELGRKWVNFKPGDFARLSHFRRIAVSAGRKPRFDDWLVAECESHPDSIARQRALAVSLDTDDKLAEATEAFARLVDLFPDKAVAWRMRAHFWHARGEYGRALADSEEACRLDANEYLNLKLKGAILVDMDRFDDALTALARASELRPSDPELLAMLAQARGNQGDHAGALENLDAALRLEPGSATLWASRGEALTLLGHLAEGAQSFRRAARLTPQDGRIWDRWAVALARRGVATQDEAPLRDALEKHAEALTLSPRDSDCWYDWGVTLGRLADMTGDQDLRRQACEKYAKAVEITG